MSRIRSLSGGSQLFTSWFAQIDVSSLLEQESWLLLQWRLSLPTYDPFSHTLSARISEEYCLPLVPSRWKVLEPFRSRGVCRRSNHQMGESCTRRRSHHSTAMSQAIAAAGICPCVQPRARTIHVFASRRRRRTQMSRYGDLGSSCPVQRWSLKYV